MTTPPPPSVLIEVRARTDYLEPHHREALESLPDVLRSQGVETQLVYRELGGMGAPPLDILTAYLVGVGGGLTVELAKATIKGLIEWGRKRIREQPPEYEDYEPPEGWRVRTKLYGPKGELLKVMDVKRDSVDAEYTHPDIDGEQDR